MNTLIEEHLEKLKNMDSGDCWYITKQDTTFWKLCYYVKILLCYKESDSKDKFEDYFKQEVIKLNELNPEFNLSNNYRILNNAELLGLLYNPHKEKKKLPKEHLEKTEVYDEILRRTNGNFEKVELYKDIMINQIEKYYIYSQEKKREGYFIFPIIFLYKILLEMGISTGKYYITRDEFRYLLCKQKNNTDYLDTLLLIKELRMNPDLLNRFKLYRDKLDNRINVLFADLDTINCTHNDRYSLNLDYIEHINDCVKNIELLGKLNIDECNNIRKSNISIKEINTPFIENHKNILSDLENIYSRNRILFGAPGTGKSHTLNTDRKKLLGENNKSNYERVTFHPDYAYANFVGTYKPVMVEDSFENITDVTEKDVVSVLTDKSKSAQEKYDLLYDKFKDDGLTRLPLLLGLYTDENFTTRKADGSDAVGDNSVEKNHGKAIRPYVNLSKPTSRKKDISYEYVPGPFMRILVKALKNLKTDNPKPFLLIIEEINRANVASVFGEVFQLLDRGEDGSSEYEIATTSDMRRYLAEELNVDEKEVETIRIPNNMFIWATMNSADQGVFPMDTAFKRRWDFTYLGIDENDDKLNGKYVYLSEDKTQKVEWNKLRKAINNFLADQNINEDKQMGPYFISKSIILPENGDEIDRDKFIDVFKNKVIMYLFEDAAKQKRSTLFAGCSVTNRYSDICKDFDRRGVEIFHPNISENCI